MMDQTNAYIYEPKQGSTRTQRKEHPNRITKSWGLRAAEIRRKHAMRLKVQDDDEERITRATHRVSEFIHKTENSPPTLAAAFVQTGPGSDVFSALSKRLSKLLGANNSRRYINLQSASGTNLRRLLQLIITTALNQPTADDSAALEEPAALTYSSASLNLRTFERKLVELEVRSVIIAFEDSEAFDGVHLAGLTEILTRWTSKIHFSLIFGIQTSVDNFRARLPASCKRALRMTQLFDLSESQKAHEQRFWRYVNDNASQTLLDSKLLDIALPASAEHIDAGSIHQINKHAEMSHLFANEITVLTSQHAKFQDIEKDTFEALRQLPSFQAFIESRVDTSGGRLAHSLMTDDKELFNVTQTQLLKLREDLDSLCQTLQLLQDCYGVLFRKTLSWDNQERMQILSGHIKTVRSVKTLSDGFKLADQDQLMQILNILESFGDEFSKEDQHLIQALSTQTKLSSKGLISQAVANLMIKNLDKFSDDLTIRYPIEILTRNSSISVCAFWPRPRETLENGLAQPEIYLDDWHRNSDVDEVDDEEATKLGQGNPTCVLYQLLQESGALVNVSDWWEAFKAVLEDSEFQERQMMALFQRGLAELQFLGLIRPSRRKADHVLRTTWAGFA